MLGSGGPGRSLLILRLPPPPLHVDCCRRRRGPACSPLRAAQIDPSEDQS
jgi:hypothetical protein